LISEKRPQPLDSTVVAGIAWTEIEGKIGTDFLGRFAVSSSLDWNGYSKSLMVRHQTTSSILSEKCFP